MAEVTGGKLIYFAGQVAFDQQDGHVNTGAPPASTFVVIRKLARPGFLIEVEAVAVV